MGLYIKRAFILVILLQIGLQTRADFYYFLHHKEKTAYRINSITWNLEKLQSVGNWVVLNRIKLDSATRTSLPVNVEINQIPSEDANQVYFSANCTNQLYRLDLKSMIFNRMDKTFYRGDNCHAYHFFRKGVLHSVGGYGFWRTNNHIIYFDEKSKEWEAYSSTGTPPQGIYGGFVAYLPEKDELISFMNYSHDVNVNNGAFFRDKAIYTYSFKSNKWSQRGSVYSKFFLELFDKIGLLGPVILNITSGYLLWDKQTLFFYYIFVYESFIIIRNDNSIITFIYIGRFYKFIMITFNIFVIKRMP